MIDIRGLITGLFFAVVILIFSRQDILPTGSGIQHYIYLPPA